MISPPPMTMSEWGCSCGFHLRQMVTALRCLLEVCAALTVLSWSTSRLPEALRLSALFLRRLASVMVSTPFVFFVGNAIIVTLLVANTKSTGKSGDVGGKRGVPATGHVKTQAHHNHTRQLKQKQGLVGLEQQGVDIFHRPHEQQHQDCYSPVPPPAEDVYYEDKAVCLVEKSPSVHIYRRTKSDRIAADFSKPQAELRRTVTDVAPAVSKEEQLSVPTKKRARGHGRRPDHSVASRYPRYDYGMDVEAAEEEGEFVDEEPIPLSDEELRRRVEAFIAKQLKFRREEELSMSVTSSYLNSLA